MTELVPLGDRAFLARFATEDDALRWAQAVRTRGCPGIVDVVTAYATVGVYADPGRADLGALWAELVGVVPSHDETGQAGRVVTLPVFYVGVDLPEVACRLGLAEAEVVAAHVASEYRVYALGFLPGFVYAGYLPASLRGLARRDSPRTRVPAGSVAIVGTQTGVYPAESPGGWHLIGRTPLSIVDVETGRFPVHAGDRLRFVPIGADEFARRLGEPLR